MARAVEQSEKGNCYKQGCTQPSQASKIFNHNPELMLYDAHAIADNNNFSYTAKSHTNIDFWPQTKVQHMTLLAAAIGGRFDPIGEI